MNLRDRVVGIRRKRAQFNKADWQCQGNRLDTWEREEALEQYKDLPAKLLYYQLESLTLR